MTECYAHSANDEGYRHGLVEHLRAVAGMARDFASSFGGGEVAYYCGLWHDLGKFNPVFQQYLSGDRQRGPDHKAAGTQIACEHLGRYCGLLVQGHHGGLRAVGDLKGWLDEKGGAPAVAQALGLARAAIADLEPSVGIDLPDFVKRNPTGAELWLRTVFSAVVDADFLDTERHFNSGRSAARNPAASPQQLWERFQSRHHDHTQEAAGLVNEVRSQVYEACLAAAEQPTGLFRLAVPTGGGKTLSGMGFALRHAVVHGLDRVIVAVPYTSITQQTAEVCRAFLEEDPSAEPAAALEHHSMVETNDEDEYDRSQVWARLASENWDAPVVVTTTVQLFHSLFSNRTSSTRKLHRLARSVIILDEAQSLPPQLLDPILDALRQLTEQYGTSVVLCTATQPAFQTIKPFADITATDIVPDYSDHFRALKRVNYEWRTDPALSWDEVADIMWESPQVLTVVNTKKDALALLEILGDDEALHLSTLLCGRHRSRVIQEVRRRLERGEACRVVSTQVVEAGVDLDFPVVMRAVGPLDSIIQAAGRCNRAGRMDAGRVVVFQPKEGSAPPLGSYKLATDTTLRMLNAGPLDLDNPETVTEFFRGVYQFADHDAKGIQGKRRSFDYPEVASRFRMIDDATLETVVPRYGTGEERERVGRELERLRNGTPAARSVIRSLQPWTVQIYVNQASGMLRSGLLSEVMPGLYEWRGDYDEVTGIGGITALDPDALIV